VIRPPRAFTLVELLVVLGVIAVLVSVLLPALAGARAASRRTVALSNMRQVVTAFALYAEQYKAFPHAAPGHSTTPGSEPPFPDPPGLISYQWFPDNMRIATGSVWDLEWTWPALLAHVTPWSEAYNTWVSPGRSLSLATLQQQIESGVVEPMNQTSLRYSQSFLAHSSLWSTPASATPEALVGAQRPADVSQPSAKAILYDADLGWLARDPLKVNGHNQAATPVGFVDGHSALHDPTAASAAVANPLNNGDTRALHNTATGVRGKDY